MVLDEFEHYSPFWKLFSSKFIPLYKNGRHMGMALHVKVLESQEAPSLSLNIFTFNIICVLNPRVVILQQLCIYFSVVCINLDLTCSSNILFIIVLKIMPAVHCCQHISPY